MLDFLLLKLRFITLELHILRRSDLEMRRQSVDMLCVNLARLIKHNRTSKVLRAWCPCLQAIIGLRYVISDPVLFTMLILSNQRHTLRVKTYWSWIFNRFIGPPCQVLGGVGLFRIFAEDNVRLGDEVFEVFRLKDCAVAWV
jgi:hypothetical protein